MSSGKENFSSFGYFNAFAADLYGEAAVITGNTIDMRGYEAVFFAVAINSFASAGDNGANNTGCFLLQHASISALGVDTWSLVPNSQLIHSVAGGYDSTASTGRFFELLSKTQLGGLTGVSGNGIIFVGYKCDASHRYVRLYMSVSGAVSTFWAGGVAILGSPANWPVNDPV